MQIETEEKEKKSHLIPIFIEKKEYKVPEGSMTGAQLRSLPKPPIADDRDLWLEVPGPGDDVLVAPTLVIHLKPGMHLYTAPRTINPGRY